MNRFFLAFSLFLAMPMLLCAQEAVPAELTVELHPAGKEWFSHNEAIELRLNRPLTAAEGRLGVVIGSTDVSALFRPIPEGYRYSPQVMPLPSGETEMIVYLVGEGNQWQEKTRFPLRVLTPHGFQKKEFHPKFDIGIKAQVAEDHSPDSNAPPRETFEDLTAQFDLQGEHVHENFTMRSQFNVIGVTNQPEALRFGTEGEDAPKVDLSSYSFQFQHRDSLFTVGHLSYGSNRHLLNGFGSRGAMFNQKLANRLDFALVAMNGTSIVGWDNIVGLNETKHQFLAGTVGVEFLKRQGGLRLETTVMDGSVLPLANFNQGVVNDAEESTGLGFRLLGSDPANRFRVEAGFARSKFTNPEDPTLSQGAGIVPVQEENKNARYADISYDLLQNHPMGQNRTATLTVAYRYENVDPLFRSTGGFAQADFLSNTVEATASLANVGLQFTHNWSEDNLDDIPTILKTKTSRYAFNAAAPLTSLFSKPEAPNPWLPQVSFAYDNTHQFGTNMPVDFTETNVPDQVSELYTAGANWQATKVNAGYQFSRSFQDNRQLGRENADLLNYTNAFSFGVTPHPAFNAGVDFNLERAENKESDRVDKLRRYGFRIGWNTTSTSTLSVFLSQSHGEDDAQTSENDNFQSDVQWSLRIDLHKHIQTQFFVRYSNSDSSSRDRVFSFNQDLESWSINTGINITVL